MRSSLTPSSTDLVPSATITLRLSSAGLDSLTNGLNAMDTMSDKWSESYASLVPNAIMEIALRSSACAALTILVMMSLFAIISRRRSKQRSTQILVLAVLVLWVSNSYYWISDLHIIFQGLGHLRALAVYYINNNYGFACFLTNFQHPPPYIYSEQASALDSSCYSEMHALPHEVLQGAEFLDSDDRLNTCGSTAVLTINIAIGDGIVWWRALALYPRQHFLRVLAIALLGFTFAMGVLDVRVACDWNLRRRTGRDTGGMYVGTDYGFAATVLSLATNILATSAVALKAWQHWRFIRTNLRGLSGRTQVQRVLGVLVESGAVYCLLWAFVFALQLYERSPPRAVSDDSDDERFNWFIYYFLPTFITPLIAMYPMVIILLVTLTQSRCDMLLMDQSKASASLPLAFALRTISDGAAPSTIQVAVVSGEGRRASLNSRLSERSVSVSHPPRAASRRESAYSLRG